MAEISSNLFKMSICFEGLLYMLKCGQVQGKSFCLEMKTSLTSHSCTIPSFTHWKSLRWCLPTPAALRQCRSPVCPWHRNEASRMLWKSEWMCLGSRVQRKTEAVATAFVVRFWMSRNSQSWGSSLMARSFPFWMTQHRGGSAEVPPLYDPA